jgi:hypothetical protein
MKNKLVSLNIIFTLLFIILSALFLIYIFRNKEHFGSDFYTWKYGQDIGCRGVLNTNIELQNINSPFNTAKYNRYSKIEYNRDTIQSNSHPYTSYCDIMNYNDLLAHKCLKISPKDLSTKMNSADIANIFETIYIYNESTLYSHLLSKIQNYKNSLQNKIKGPVYICISQAPYLKYGSDLNDATNTPFSKHLDARIDILNNKNPYYSELINNNGVQTFKTDANDGDDPVTVISSLYAQILIIFPLYNKKNEEKSGDSEDIINTFLTTTMTTYYTHNDLCFIKCNKSSTINCGCLNMNSSSDTSIINTYYNLNSGNVGNKEKDFPRYNSRCIDHTNNNTPQPFSMMYFVNPYSDNYEDIIEDPLPQTISTISTTSNDIEETGEDIYASNYDNYMPV